MRPWWKIGLGLIVPVSLVMVAGAPGPARAGPLPFGVDSTQVGVDSRDSTPGDGACASALAPSYPCTLRAAIEEANASPDLNLIQFDIAPGGYQRIALDSNWNTVTAPVIIDGTSQPCFAGGPLSELYGLNAGGNVPGLRITGGGSTIPALTLNTFNGAGIGVEEAG